MRKREDDYYTNWAFLHLYCDPSALIRPNRQVKRGNITPPYPLQSTIFINISQHLTVRTTIAIVYFHVAIFKCIAT